MDDFNYYYEAVRKRIDRLEVLVGNLLSVKSEVVHKILQDCESECRRIENEFEACESAIQNLDKGADKNTAEKNFMVLRERYNKCKTEIEFKKSSGQSHALFGQKIEEEKESPKKLGEMSVQQVIERGDDLYKEAEGRLANALGISEQSKQVVGGIEVELKQQEEQIDRIHDKTEDVRSILKRANKVMSLIYRRYLTDKCIAILIILIIIILIIIIGFGAAKSGKLGFSTDSIN